MNTALSVLALLACAWIAVDGVRKKRWDTGTLRAVAALVVITAIALFRWLS